MMTISPSARIATGDLTFAVRAGCATCGYLMLFDSARYRTGNEKILVLGLERESHGEQ